MVVLFLSHPFERLSWCGVFCQNCNLGFQSWGGKWESNCCHEISLRQVFRDGYFFYSTVLQLWNFILILPRLWSWGVNGVVGFRAAGVCKFSGGGGCEIRLSEPVLKSRTTAELKTTLLHEMIHAYLFSMSGNKDHEYDDFCPSCLLQKQPFWLPCFPVCICLALLSGFLSLTLFSWGPLVMCDSDHGPCFQHLMRSINQCSADDDQVLLTTFMMSGQCLISDKECLSHKL
jgi:hypothetical protein